MAGDSYRDAIHLVAFSMQPSEEGDAVTRIAPLFHVDEMNVVRDVLRLRRLGAPRRGTAKEVDGE